jgi:hypothetical protein
VAYDRVKPTYIVSIKPAYVMKHRFMNSHSSVEYKPCPYYGVQFPCALQQRLCNDIQGVTKSFPRLLSYLGRLWPYSSLLQVLLFERYTACAVYTYVNLHVPER